jgi:DNA-directed RNA polymerase specialized sigma24 family protein
VPSRSPYASDFLFAEQCLDGNAAALRDLQSKRAQAAERFLMAAGVPRAETREAVTELMSELLASDGLQQPRLARYQGQCALETWLNRAALSRAISRRRSEERYQKRLETAASNGALPSLNVDDTSHGDNFLRQLLREVIQQAMTEVPSDDYVIIHLLFGSNLYANEVARIFQCDWRTLRDRAEATCAQVRFAVQAELQRRDPWLNLGWQELVNLLMPDLPPLYEGEERVETT